MIDNMINSRTLRVRLLIMPSIMFILSKSFVLLSANAQSVVIFPVWNAHTPPPFSLRAATGKSPSPATAKSRSATPS